MDRELIEQYAVMSHALTNAKRLTEDILNQSKWNKANFSKDRFQIDDLLTSAFNALREALTDLNDERKQYIKEVD